MGFFICNDCNTKFGPCGVCPKCMSKNVSIIKTDFKEAKVIHYENNKDLYETRIVQNAFK